MLSAVVELYCTQYTEFYNPILGLSVIDSLIKSAAFYWAMDNHKDIKNLVGSDWGRATNNLTTISGIRGKAVYVGAGASGAFTLSEGLPKSCLFDASQCNEGFTLMLWLWFKHKGQGSGQVFLSSSGNNHRGHKMYQVNSDTSQVWLEIIDQWLEHPTSL